MRDQGEVEHVFIEYMKKLQGEPIGGNLLCIQSAAEGRGIADWRDCGKIVMQKLVHEGVVKSVKVPALDAANKKEYSWRLSGSFCSGIETAMPWDFSKVELGSLDASHYIRLRAMYDKGYYRVANIDGELFLIRFRLDTLEPQKTLNAYPRDPESEVWRLDKRSEFYDEEFALKRDAHI